MGAQYCSYRVGGPLEEPYLPTTLEEALELLHQIRCDAKPLTVIGGGSNTIIASGGIRGATFLCKRLMFSEQTGPQRFRVGSGMPLAKVCKLMQDHGLTGAEYMIGVPGTLGGAVTMNAGALGQDTAGVLAHALVYNMETGLLEEWSHEQLQFAYRTSAINPKRCIVLGAELSLTPGNPPEIQARIQKNLTFRQTHHPKEPNGGSVFKNPLPDCPAGKILDELGAKGWQEGGAMVSLMHANFIINLGEATSTDILKLMLRMKQAIRTETGLEARPENRFLGNASQEEKAIWEELTGHAWVD